MDGIVVPGGFGDRGIEGKIETVRFARENGVPYLGICLGMQVAVIEAARNLAGLEDEASEKGGTMRLGAQQISLEEGSLAATSYGATSIEERHRHRYEVNNNYRDTLEKAGLRFSGLSVDDLVEMVENPEHPWFLASQFHPEFTSNPRDGHPLFTGFVAATRKHREGSLPKVAEA